MADRLAPSDGTKNVANGSFVVEVLSWVDEVTELSVRTDDWQ